MLMLFAILKGLKFILLWFTPRSSETFPDSKTDVAHLCMLGLPLKVMQVVTLRQLTELNHGNDRDVDWRNRVGI